MTNQLCWKKVCGHVSPIYELGHAMYCTETDTSAVSYIAKELVGALQCSKVAESGGVTR